MLQSSADSVAQSFYYATIRDPEKPANQRSRSGCRIINSDEASPIILPPISGTIAETEPFTAVNLGPLLGQGESGHVYRGTWNGATVAVKVRQPLTSELPLCQLLNTIYFFICFCLSRDPNQPVCLPARQVQLIALRVSLHSFAKLLLCICLLVRLAISNLHSSMPVLVVSSMCVCTGGGGTACQGG